MEPRLTIRFTPEKGDYVRASRTLAQKSPWFLVLAGLILLAVIGSALLVLFPALGSENLRSMAYIVLLAGIVYLLYYLLMIPWQLGRAYQANEHLRLERTLTFFDTHLTMGFGERGVDLPWKNLQKVVDGGDYYLMMFKGDQLVYPFIPGRAIPSTHDRQALLAFFGEKSIPVI
jgi:hypothetical protein